MNNILLNDISEYGLLNISGTDAKKFLQGQLTCQMDIVVDHQMKIAAHCNPKGRLISLFYIGSFDQAYFLLLPGKMLEITLNSLKKYAVFYKVSLSDMSDDHAMLHDIIHQVIHLFSMKDADAYLKHRLIEHRIPQIYPETSGYFLPQEINLHDLNAIDFEKGCYTGQEIIARIHYRGKLKSRLINASIQSAMKPNPGSLIYYGDTEKKVCGTIVDLYEKAYNQYVVLMVVEDRHIKNDHLFLDNP